MTKVRSSHSYELELKRMIKSRTGVDMEPWLLPQLRATAKNMAILDKMQDEIEQKTKLVTMMPGSTGALKQEAHPLLAYYDKLQRTLIQQFEALGLNYRSTPSKMKETVSSGGDEHDKLNSLLEDIKNI